MPEVSRFFGIVIQMYVDDHVPPHFHARHAGMEAVVAIDTWAILKGRLSPRGTWLGGGMGIAARGRAPHRLGARKVQPSIAADRTAALASTPCCFAFDLPYHSKADDSVSP